jgi:iron complex transport system substrate-binding protein
MIRNQPTLPARRGGGRKGAAFVAFVLLGAACVAAGIEALRRFSPSPETPTHTAGAPAGRARAPYPRTLRDAGGNQLTIRQRPARIVSQTLGTDEILLAICQPERIVAFSKLALDPKYSNVVGEARAAGAPALQNAEAILQLNPDLIFVAHYSRAEAIEQLQAAGAPAFRFENFDRIEDIKTNIRTVGHATGDDEQAESLVRRMDEELASIRARIPQGGARPRVMSYGYAGYTAGANTLFDDIIRHAGGTNVAAERGINGFGKISAEQLLEWQPDFIVVGANRDEFEEVKQQLLGNPAVAATNAARAGRVITLDNRYFLTVSHHVVRAVEALADELYAPGPGNIR